MNRFCGATFARMSCGGSGGFGSTIIRASLSLLVVLSLSGCGSIFDPAPYSPLEDPTVKDEMGQPYTIPAIVVFSDLNDATAKLLAMDRGYERKRNALMGQQLVFDVPAIGLGVASVASVAFHGAATVSTGLALGAATVYGSKTYFEPGTRIAAYNSASQSMLCAASAAASLNAAENAYQSAAEDVQGRLAANIQIAGDYLSGFPVNGAQLTLTSDQRAALLTAWGNAQKSLADLNAALQILYLATAKLQSFAVATISKATSTIVNGMPDPSAILKTIQAGIVPGVGSPAAQKAIGENMVDTFVKATPGSVVPKAITDIVNQLTSDSSDAENYVTGINTAWGSFTSCTTGG